MREELRCVSRENQQIFVQHSKELFVATSKHVCGFHLAPASLHRAASLHVRADVACLWFKAEVRSTLKPYQHSGPTHYIWRSAGVRALALAVGGMS